MAGDDRSPQGGRPTARHGPPRRSPRRPARVAQPHGPARGGGQRAVGGTGRSARQAAADRRVPPPRRHALRRGRRPRRRHPRGRTTRRRRRRRRPPPLLPRKPGMTLMPDVDPADLDRLTARLALAADDAGLLDVAWTTVDTPVGPLLLAGTPQGLVRVAYGTEGHDAVLQTLADRISPRGLRAPARLSAAGSPRRGLPPPPPLSAAVRQLEEYFAGRRTAFELPLDLRLAAGFR